MEGYLWSMPLHSVSSAFEEWPWKAMSGGLLEPLSVCEVATALRDKCFEETPYAPCKGGWEWSRVQHIQRIAYLVQHGWVDPVCVILFGNEVLIDDGHHRVAAAKYRGCTTIAAKVQDWS